jgi:hypothetical protein
MTKVDNFNQSNVILSKKSGENEIRTYFEKVLELKQSNEQFPVDLDEVWPLVYAEKGTAIRALKRNFIEGVDFVSLGQNVKREIGATKVVSYLLSVSCLEYFIARKVRSVFEVYRQVFHKTTEQKQLSTLDLLELSVKSLRGNQQDLQEVKRELRELKAKTATFPDYFTVVGYASLHKISISLKLASSIGRKASLICKQYGYSTGEIPDPRFGRVKTYPFVVLDQVFDAPII